MGKFVNLSGKVFGRLTVISRLPSKNKKTIWYCECSCGNSKLATYGELVSKNTTSCGCYKKDKRSSLNTTHGMSKTKFYQTWLNIKKRCDDANCEFYQNYGGRGISYCDEWRDFNLFYTDMFCSYEDGLSIERLDVNGDYCKENCCWIDKRLQARNRTKPVNNSSGYTGVSVIIKDGLTIGYRARWSENGKQKTKYFTFKSYGEKAFEEACSFRKKMIIKLEYGLNHGV